MVTLTTGQMSVRLVGSQHLAVNFMVGGFEYRDLRIPWSHAEWC